MIRGGTIRVQAEDFDPGAELAALHRGREDVGGIASFIGVVRGGDTAALTLEHYPGMTERQLEAIAEEAQRRWNLIEVKLIHRHGRLRPGERIVFVGVAASHRQAAFTACEFLVDWLKTKAPFWKQEEGPEGSRWVETHEEDAARAARWDHDIRPLAKPAAPRRKR